MQGAGGSGSSRGCRGWIMEADHQIKGSSNASSGGSSALADEPVRPVCRRSVAEAMSGEGAFDPTGEGTIFI
jgi:hypothetical protein